jgi:hypothetical protein
MSTESKYLDVHGPEPASAQQIRHARASLRSVLMIMADKAARTWRVSIRTAVKP